MQRTAQEPPLQAPLGAVKHARWLFGNQWPTLTNGRSCSQAPRLPGAGPQPQEALGARGSLWPRHLAAVLWEVSTHPGVVSIVKEKPQYGKNPVVMVDEILSSSPPKFNFPEAGLRIMITNKFGPRTRLRMASRIIINERQRLISSANSVSSKPLQNGTHENIENGNVPVENPEDPQQDQEQQPPPQPPPPEPEPVETAFLSPFSMPGTFGWVLGAPAMPPWAPSGPSPGLQHRGLDPRGR
ncbi:Hypothetical predicted protein [Marmota monax]|uniref:Uncharacterized protein n=1 Tax=Marmota monax TaxID=9995 RepID=A0A5E4AN36_MARMO|nr:hypothetical protein GHT09_001629 [Marmota monax]VTJ58728.1 Hypothetical predicted protein [Marmota monax]